LSTEALRAQRRQISKEIAALGRAAVLRRAHEMIVAGMPRFMAYELVQHHKATMESIDAAEVEKLGKGMAGWGEVDAFGCFIAGQAWRMGRIADSVVRKWVRSEDWQWRRAALVATVPLNSRAQGGSGDTKRTLNICRLLVPDRHDLVVKALSWALRELSKRDPESVRAFLVEQRAELAARVVREVTSKLETGLKNPRGSTAGRRRRLPGL
jgi:3-methyladenine DNA glycosylase AlkD